MSLVHQQKHMCNKLLQLLIITFSPTCFGAYCAIFRENVLAHPQNLTRPGCIGTPFLHFHVNTEHLYIVDIYIYANNSKKENALLQCHGNNGCAEALQCHRLGI